MRGFLATTLRISRWTLALLAPVSFGAASGAPLDASFRAGWDPAAELVVIFGDGFEAQDCSLWSASSNPLGAPDQDSDTYGDAGQPTVYCQLPANLVPDASDCNDNNPLVHPGATELCNGIDDDCSVNTPDGLGDPQTGLACDGGDSDLCLEGTNSCTNGSIQCSDASGSTIDLCNGFDDDCDPASADGSEDPQNGVACDGGDTDLCFEGARFCSAGSLECSDTSGSTIDICNGFDDDCDPASADGSEDPQNGVACDGGDSDLCIEGAKFCDSGAMACSDTTGSTIDLCNGADDDCDPASADGSEDPQSGVACDGDDGDLCVEGTLSCLAASLFCSDLTGTTSEICNGLDDDCDGATDEDFTLDTNPVCLAATAIGSIAGDTGSASLTRVSYAEAWFRFTLSEASIGSVQLSAQLNLFSGVGSDFDLYVYCLSCGGTLAGSSAVHGLAGHTDTVYVRANDETGVDDTIDLLVEVRYFASSRCGNWTLDIFGNVGAGAWTCP